MSVDKRCSALVANLTNNLAISTASSKRNEAIV